MILSDREARAAVERRLIGVTPCPPLEVARPLKREAAGTRVRK